MAKIHEKLIMNNPAELTLSIIVPTFNDATVLPILLTVMDHQIKAGFELIVVDGGSDDDTITIVSNYATRVDFPVNLFRSARGRGRQLNMGAEQAKGRTLLFLHADSSFTDPHALADGLFYFEQEVDHRQSDALAGRFGLRFLRTQTGFNRTYAYYESKARLNRPGCIHGDQGMMIRRTFFTKIGPFNSAMPFLEDEILAEKVFEHGEWLLLPADIFTSARRFEKEGLIQRQTLNALILNALAIGWNRFLYEAPDLYRFQDKTGKLDLLPYFSRLRQLLKELSWKQRWRTWWRTGAYVRDNGWQILLMLDVWREVRRQPDCREGPTPLLSGFEHWFDCLSNHAGGQLLATGGVWCWFYLTLLCLKIRQRFLKILRK